MISNENREESKILILLFERLICLQVDEKTRKNREQKVLSFDIIVIFVITIMWVCLLLKI